ncbi:hypothetical protein PVA45_06665 [Entomospira entomophila]|uniref:Uncharacterized protein n=1 Tax=Entomospira entomophila TaxID=2719988 RepID=A0A968GAY7_9SPIO|nr:hypothetical protein [Entomospira entomophilus]NIZ41182.1 hypothetical protein [Entomospira entomophilus]WDI35389.1 hypothetical protein PVA45_06665 [Entomospira entomophilus]
MGAQEVYVQVSNLHQRDIRKHIQQSLYKIDGVDALDCNDEGHHIYFRIDEDRVSRKTILEVIRNAGGHVVSLRSRYPYRAVNYPWFHTLLALYMVYAVMHIFEYHTPLKSSWFSVLQAMLLLFVYVGYLRIRKSMRVAMIVDESLILFRYIGFGWLGLVVLFIMQHVQLRSDYLDSMLMTILHAWFLSHSMIAICFIRYRIRLQQKPSVWIETKVHSFATSVMIGQARYAQSPIVMIPGDRFRLEQSQEVLPVDARLISPFCYVRIDGIRIRVWRGQRILAGTVIESEDTLFEATTDFASSILMREKGKYTPSTHLQRGVSPLAIPTHQVWSYWIFYLTILIASWSMQEYITFSEMVRWVWVSMILLSLGAFWIPYWQWILRIVGYRIFQDDIARLGIISDKGDLYSRAKERKTFWIHLRAFPLVADWAQAGIVCSDAILPVMREILSQIKDCECPEIAENLVDDVKMVLWREEMKIHHHTGTYQAVFIDDVDGLVGSEVNDAYDAERHHRYEIFDGKNQSLGYLLVPLVLSEMLKTLITRAIRSQWIVVLAGDMSQRMINDLAREVGVLEAYGNCDDTRLEVLLHKHMNKEQPLITITPPSFTHSSLKTNSAFLEIRELQYKEQDAIGNIAYLEKFEINRILTFMYLLQNFDVYYRYFSKVLAFIVFLVYTVAIAYIIFTHQNLVGLSMIVAIVGVVSIMGFHHFYIWYRRRAQRTVHKQ